MVLKSFRPRKIPQWASDGGRVIWGRVRWGKSSGAWVGIGLPLFSSTIGVEPAVAVSPSHACPVASRTWHDVEPGC